MTTPQMSEPVNYARLDHDYARHHRRFVRRVESQTPRLTCQECGGSGGYIERVLDDGSGPFTPCGFCEGTGLVTSWLRGQWLRWRREDALALASARAGERDAT